MSVKKKKKTALYSNIIFSLIALVSLTAVIIMLLLNYSSKKKLEDAQNEISDLKNYNSQFIYTQDDLDNAVSQAEESAEENGMMTLINSMRDRLSGGDSAYNLFRDIFADDLIVYDSDEGYIFYPITDQYIKSGRSNDDLVKDEETGEVQYIKDGSVLSVKGIDVSKHNGDIDWEKVKNDGVSFAIIRVGYRGSTGGSIKLDETFEDNIKGAIENGIDVGVYFFTQAISVDEAIEEAEFVIDAIDGYELQYPVVWDIEELEGRAEDVDRETRTDACIAFLDKIKEAGYSPMIYGNLKSLLYMLNTDRIEGYDKWFAYYSFPDYYPYAHSIWQYSSTGEVDGIKGNVDMNIAFK